jgi:hypothetical protein
MKKLTISLMSLALTCLGVAAAAAQEEGDGSLTAAERTELLELLERSEKETEKLIAATADETWAVKPAEDRWSVGEVVEHLALVEQGTLALATGALEGEEQVNWEVIAAQGVAGLVKGLQDRSQKFQAPEGFAPQGEMKRQEVVKLYADARAKTRELVTKTKAQVKRYTAEGPPGTMNVHQWLALIGAHNLRHNQQIVEVQEQLATAKAP